MHKPKYYRTQTTFTETVQVWHLFIIFITRLLPQTRIRYLRFHITLHYKSSLCSSLCSEQIAAAISGVTEEYLIASQWRGLLRSSPTAKPLHTSISSVYRSLSRQVWIIAAFIREQTALFFSHVPQEGQNPAHSQFTNSPHSHRFKHWNRCLVRA